MDYYPKLVGMSPFTPAVGYRFLMDPQEDEGTLTHLMVMEIDRFCDRNRLSGGSLGMRLISKLMRTGYEESHSQMIKVCESISLTLDNLYLY